MEMKTLRLYTTKQYAIPPSLKHTNKVRAITILLYLIFIHTLHFSVRLHFVQQCSSHLSTGSEHFHSCHKIYTNMTKNLMHKRCLSVTYVFMYHSNYYHNNYNRKQQCKNDKIQSPTQNLSYFDSLFCFDLEPVCGMETCVFQYFHQNSWARSHALLCSE